MLPVPSVLEREQAGHDRVCLQSRALSPADAWASVASVASVARTSRARAQDAVRAYGRAQYEWRLLPIGDGH